MSDRIDRYLKAKEYAAVSAILRYVILESSSVDLTVFERSGPNQIWQTILLTKGDVLRMPGISVEVPVDEIYRNLAFFHQDQSA